MQKKDINILTTVILDVPLIAEGPTGKITLFTYTGLENKIFKANWIFAIHSVHLQKLTLLFIHLQPFLL